MIQPTQDKAPPVASEGVTPDGDIAGAFRQLVEQSQCSGVNWEHSVQGQYTVFRINCAPAKKQLPSPEI